MDVLYFLEERLTFIRYYYETASSAFTEIQRKIEAEEAPYDDPLHDESGEPPFLEEWSAAAHGLVLVGRSCVSMLSGSMQLYFKAWERELGVKLDDDDRKQFKNGILNGYRYVFECILKRPLADSGAHFELLEQVILARNADQHEGDLTTIHASHPERDRKRFGKQLFFVNETERKWLDSPDAETNLFFFGHVEAPRDVLFKSIDEFEKLANWLEPMLIEVYQGRYTPPRSA